MIYQKHREVKTLRNVNGRATRKSVMAAGPLRLDLLSPTFADILPCLHWVDNHRPHLSSIIIADELKDELPGMLMGRCSRWKLWECELHTNRFVLHFVNMGQETIGNRKATDLSCFIYWEDGVDLKISTPMHSDIYPNFYQASFKAKSECENVLSIAYPEKPENDQSFFCIETYQISPSALF